MNLAMSVLLFALICNGLAMGLSYLRAVAKTGKPALTPRSRPQKRSHCVKIHQPAAVPMLSLTALDQPFKRLEPRLAVLVRYRHAPAHLLGFLRWMAFVGIVQLPAEFLTRVGPGRPRDCSLGRPGPRSPKRTL